MLLIFVFSFKFTWTIIQRPTKKFVSEEVLAKANTSYKQFVATIIIFVFFLELRDRLRISLLIRANFSELFNFYYPWNRQTSLKFA